MGLRLYGATSGYVDVEVPDVADNGVVTLSPNLMSPGLVLIRKESFAGATSIPLDGVFTSQYKNYKIVFRCDTSANGSIVMRLRAAGANITSATYHGTTVRSSGASVAIQYDSNGATDLYLFTNGLAPGHVQPHFSMDLLGPNLAAPTHGHFIGQSAAPGSYGRMTVSGDVAEVSSTQSDGFTIYPTAGTFTGDVYVYGYAEIVGDYPQLNKLPGLELIRTQSFAAAATVSVDDCFSSEFDNYQVLLTAACSSGQELFMRLRSSGVDDTTNLTTNLVFSPVVSAYNSISNPYFNLGQFATVRAFWTLDVFGPSVAASTGLLVVGRGNTYSFFGGGEHPSAASFDGFTLYPSAGTFAGSLSVYGYRKA